jgi:hypothetical protein
MYKTTLHAAKIVNTDSCNALYSLETWFVSDICSKYPAPLPPPQPLLPSPPPPPPQQQQQQRHNISKLKEKTERTN